MNPKNTTNRFAFRPDSKRYLPLVKPSSSQEMVYEPLSKIRVNSRKGEVDGVSLLHTLRNVTPIGSSLLNSPRGRSPSKPLEGKTLQEAIESLPNDRIRLGFIELSYSMCKQGHSCSTEYTILISFIQKVSEELNKLINALDKLKSEQQQGQLQQLQRQRQLSQRKEENVRQAKPKPLLKVACCSQYQSPQQQNRTHLENVKLALVNKSLAQRVKELEKELKESAVVTSPGQSNIDQEALNAIDRCHYLEMKLKNEEKKTAMLMEEVEAMQLSVRQATVLTDQRRRIEEEAMAVTRTWRERCMMLQEDLSGRADREEMILSYLRRLKDKRTTAEQRRPNSTERNLKVVMRSETFKAELQFLKGVRGEDAKIPQYRQQLRYKNDDLGAEVGNLEYQIAVLRARKQEEVYLPQYSYWRPTFYNLIEHLPADPKPRRSNEVSREFVQKLRGIMNSKLNEFLLLPVVEYTRFPEFVLSWLDLYDFEPSTGEVVLRPNGQPSQAQRFYSDLINFKLDQTWQVVTFRQFLLEELSLEELYFYLMCQNILYRRAAVTTEKLFFGDLTIMVELGIARSVMYTIMSEFDPTNIEYFLTRLSERAVLRKGKQLVESGFLLRCLLECYKVERTNRFKFISKVCRQQLASEDPNDRHSTGKLDLVKTMKVFGLFGGLTYTTKLGLYRECYSVSRGTVTPEVIFSVLTEHRVFLESLRIRTFHRLPMMLKGSDDCNTVQPCLGYLPPVFQQLRELLSPGSDFSQLIINLGVDSINYTIESYRRYFLQKKLESDNCLMRCKHFLHFLASITSKIREVGHQQLYQVLDDIDHRANYFPIPSDENVLGQLSLKCLNATLQEFYKTRWLIEWKARVQTFRATVAARKIQRHIRQKFIRPYLQLYNNMLAKAKGVMHQQMSATMPNKAFQELKKLNGRNISLTAKPRAF